MRTPKHIKSENIFEQLMEACKYCSLGQLTAAMFEVGGAVPEKHVMRSCLLLMLFTLCLTCSGQMKSVQRPDGTIWKNNKHARGFFETGWKRYDYDSTGVLLRESEFASIVKDTYLLREVEYVNGQPVVVFSKTWFARAYLRGLYWFMLVFFATFFSRVFVNSGIYNRENNTDMSPVYAHIGPLVTNNFGHSLASTFTFWWKTEALKLENQRAAVISNFLSVTALVLFFGSLIGLALSGELH
ncbi:MAG: hypothetical protein ABI432_05495 [Flavobacteriales bacterium]